MTGGKQMRGSLTIIKVKEGGFLVGDGIDCSDGMYRGSLFASTSIGEALAWIKKEMVGEQPAESMQEMYRRLAGMS
jgi:hypothetical protein